MKRILALLLFLPSLALGQDLSAKYLSAINEGGAGLNRGLIFHAPFTDPSSPLTLYKGIGSLSFARAHDATHVATFVHPTTGLVTAASADQLRIEAQGALIEGARTNSAIWSETFGLAATWVPVTMSVDNNSVVAPDGNTTAETLSASGANGTLLQTVTAAAGANTFSVYLKRKDGVGAVRVGTDGTDFTACTINAATWTRCSVTKTLLAVPVTIGIQIATSGDNVYVWGGQMETGGFASSYIPTVATTISRNVDVLTFSESGNIASAEGTVSVLMDTRFPGADYPRVLSSFAGGSIPLWINNTNGKLSSYDRVNAPDASVVYTAGASSRAVVKWGGILFGWALDGVLSTTGTFDGSMDAGAGTMRIGNDVVSPSDPAQLYGHVKDLRIWNRALSDSELQAITR